MSGKTCKACGSADLETDPSRGDIVCTNCGTVIEDSVIVSEIQYEENAGGGVTSTGQFVSSEYSGGCRGFGSSFLSGSKESRDITLLKAKRQISSICDQLRLNQHCLDTAYNFYKMALNRHFTRGRRSKVVFSACVYLTCRIEGTPHLLIDLSDLLQISPYQLGKTYVTLTQSLCINVPSVDPCLYVLRYAGSLQLGDKTHEVSTLALRIVQRMKKDNLHTGRRPSGICGAALLLASRLHNFNRSVGDIIKVVQVHESTLRKRLVEFGDTPSSSLTLKEFMSTDLTEEQDPPSFKAARLKDEQLLQQKLDQNSLEELKEIQTRIDNQISGKRKRKYYSLDCSPSSELTSMEEADLERFMNEATLGILEEYLEDNPEPKEEDDEEEELGPDLVSLGVNLDVVGVAEETESNKNEDPAKEDSSGNNLQSSEDKVGNPDDKEGELDIEGLDDEELDAYIMPAAEAKSKSHLWHNINAQYLKEQEEKKERLKKELEEGKPEKKKKKYNGKKKDKPTASTAGEAIEKMLQEKKISTKINYDVKELE